MNSDMGLMTALSITLSLVMDFLILPVLLVKTAEIKKETKAPKEIFKAREAPHHDKYGTRFLSFPIDATEPDFCV